MGIVSRRKLFGLPVAGLVLGAVGLPKSARAIGTLGNVIDVTDWGLVGDGLTDNLLPLTLLIAISPPGSVLYFPPGSYRLSDVISCPKRLTFAGADPVSSVLVTTNATADLLSLDEWGCTVRNIGFSSSVTKTDGALIATKKSRHLLRDILLDHYYTGISLDGSTSTHVENVRGGNNPTGANVAPGGALIELVGVAAADVHLRALTCNSAGGAAMPSYGILVRSVLDVNISDCEILQHGTNIAMLPGAGESVASVNVVHSYFDTATRQLLIAPTGTGIVTRCGFTHCWFSLSSANNIWIEQPAGTTVNQVDFTACQVLYAANYGVVLAGGVNINLNGGYICASGADGVYVAAGVSHWSVCNMRIGNAGGLGNNLGHGLLVAAGPSDWYRVMGNDFSGNTMGGLVDAGTGTHKAIPPGSNLL